jgi:hypothetical protein
MFYYDLLTDKLLLNRGAEPIARLDMESPAFEDLEVSFFNGTNTIHLPATAEIRFGLKSKSGVLLALTDEWTKDPRTGKYSATLSTNTEEMATALGSNAHIDVYAQMVFRESPSADPQISQVIEVRVYKSQITFADGTPTLLPNPEEWLEGQFADAPSKASPVDADTGLLADSADGGALKKWTFLGLWNYIAGKAGLGFLRFDQPQSLTDGQKAQGLGNLGAVPLAFETDGTPYAVNTLEISGDLTVLGSPIVFPPLFENGTYDGKFRYENGSARCQWAADVSLWGLTYEGAEWYSSEDVLTPDQVTSWTPSGDSAGTPTVTLVAPTEAEPGQMLTNSSDADVIYFGTPDGEGFATVRLYLKAISKDLLGYTPKAGETVYLPDFGGCTCVGDGSSTVNQLPWQGTHVVQIDSAWVAANPPDSGVHYVASNAENLVVSITEDVSELESFYLKIPTSLPTRITFTNQVAQSNSVFISGAQGAAIFTFPDGVSEGDMLQVDQANTYFSGQVSPYHGTYESRVFLFHTNATIAA